MRIRAKPLAFGFLALTIGGGALVLALAPDLADDLRDAFSQARLERLVAEAGVWGPLAVVALMTAAVVASPLPSAPVALAAGAAYGHTAGTVYVAAGAEIGALVAFGLARWLGREPMRRWFGDKIDAGLMGSQNALTATVFVSRLLPFVSFDLMSYAAGLTCLRTWRFALATLAGILPASFLLAHFGKVAAEGEWRQAGWLSAGLALATGLPLLWAAWQRRRRKLRP